MRDIHAIMRQDALRRAERDQQEIDSFLREKGHVSAPKGVDPYHFSRSNRGVPSNGNRTYRNHDTSKYPRTRGFTTAVTGDLNNPDTRAVLTDAGEATVKVTRDGVTTFVPATTFTHARDTRTTRTRTNTAPTRERTGIIAADHQNLIASLPAIGNVE